MLNIFPNSEMLDLVLTDYGLGLRLIELDFHMHRMPSNAFPGTNLCNGVLKSATLPLTTRVSKSGLALNFLIICSTTD